MKQTIFGVLLALLTATAGWGQQSIIDQLTFKAGAVSPVVRVTAVATGVPGTVSLYYWVIARYPAGVSIQQGPGIARQTQGVAGLGANPVAVSWPAQPGATGYDVIRLVTPNWPLTNTCANCVVASNTAALAFKDVGGGVVNWPTAGTVQARGEQITASINNRDQSGPVLNWTSAVASPWFPALGFPKIQSGTTASYLTNFTTGDNIWQIYARDATATGYTDGFSVTLAASGGNGTGGIRPVQLVGRAEKGSNLGELYGASVYAIQDDGSIVRPNLYGLTSWLQINEVNAADAPNGYVAGVMGIYQTPGVNPTTTFQNPGGKAALMGVVKDGSANNIPDAVVLAMLEGDAAPTATVPAAFRAVTVRSTPGGQYTYGLDLANLAGPAQPTISAAGADIKLHYFATVDNDDLANLHITGVAGNNFLTDFRNTAGGVIVRSTQYFDGADGADFAARHARGTIAAPVILNAGDELGSWRANGWDGNDFVGGAGITAIVDAAPGAGDMPGALIISTANDGAIAMTERARFSRTGGMTIAPLTQGNLGAPANGTIVYCSNCDPAIAGAGPTVCSTGGASSGALAIRLNGAWTCVGI
jgi:hypothetical protein